MLHYVASYQNIYLYLHVTDHASYILCYRCYTGLANVMLAQIDNNENQATCCYISFLNRCGC